MFTYRLRGLLNLYILVTAGLIAGFFLSFAAATRYIPWLQLSPSVDLFLWLMLVLGGMALSGRFVTAIGWRFHEMGWADAAWLATRQVGTVTIVVFTMIAATRNLNMSRVFLGLFLVLSWFLLLVVNRRLPRFLAGLAFSRLNRLPTLFVGQGRDLRRLNDWIKTKEHLGVSPVGYLSDDDGNGSNEALGRYCGPVSALARTIEELRATQVILVNVPAKQEDARSILAVCQSAGCRVLIHDNIAERVPVPMIPVVEEGQFFLTLQDEPLEDPFNRAVKRVFDLAVSIPVVALILPPLCVFVKIVQIASKAPGPLFFVRPRGGRMRTEFGMVKFRSMYHEPVADSSKEAVQAHSGDERIFPMGGFLRKSSIDEFPQFWNVLKGDMSVVGPRPHLPRHDHEFSQIAVLYRTRHLVKPGITGLAQIRGFRGEIVDPEVLHRRVAFDIDYITHWSIWLDAQITLKTMWQVFRPPGSAY